MNKKSQRQVSYVLDIHNNVDIFLKMSNFGKFADCITDNVRLVQQNSRHLVGIINKIWKKNYFNELCLLIFLPYDIIYRFLNFKRFILIKNVIYGEKYR